MNLKNSKYDLKLPVIEKDAPPSVKSVDEVRRWIDELYPDLFDREAYEKNKREISVNEPFFLMR